MTTADDRNAKVIEEFRSREGIVGGDFEGSPMLLLTGSKSGREITKPLMFLRDHDRFFVFASKGGSPENPAWYRNLIVNPIVTVEIGNESFQAKAGTVTGPERDNLYARQTTLYPRFGDYQRKTERVIPVVELSRQEPS